MREHGRQHVRKIRQHILIIFLDKKVYGMAARRDNNVAFVVLDHSFVFVFDDCRADCRFFHVEKAQFFQGFSHAFYADVFIISDERRRKADVNGIARLNKDFRLFDFGRNFFCVLRTYDEALPAQNALVADNVRLIARKSDGLHRAVADTFITVFAV